MSMKLIESSATKEAHRTGACDLGPTRIRYGKLMWRPRCPTMPRSPLSPALNQPIQEPHKVNVIDCPFQFKHSKRANIQAVRYSN